MKKKHLLFAVIVLMFATLNSCRKDKKEVLDNTITIDNSTAENLFSDMFKVIDQVSNDQEGIREDEIGCIDTIIVDTVSNPHSVMIDFGTNDCVGDDGRVRKGKIFVTYTGRYRDQGTVITATPQNYTVNGYTVSGIKTITNLGENSLGQTAFAISVDGSITAPGNAWTSQWQSDRVRTWVEGENSITIWDDAYTISGTASGINRNGIEYNISITTPLRAEVGCRWIVSGSLILTPEGYDPRVVDFGNGECNNGFSVTVNGETNNYGSGD